MATMDEYDFEFEPVTTSGKEGIVFFGQKGSGKTSAAYLLEGEKVVLSFDGKSLRVKETMRPDDKSITVFDTKKYMSHWKHELTASANKNFAYVMYLLGEIEKRGGCDWILIDGLEILIEVAEMKMRYDHKVGPFDGFSNLGFWKDRKMNIRAVYDACYRAAKQGIVFCYDEITRAMTPDGLKTLNELNPGDMVYSLNASGEIELKPVKTVYKFDYDGKMVAFKGRATDLLVTPEHRMITAGSTHGKWYTERWRFETAKSLLGRSIFRFPVGRWVGTLPKQQLPCDAGNFFYVMGLYIGDGCMNERRMTPYKGKQYGPYKWAQFCIPEGDRARDSAVVALNHNGGLKLKLYPNTIEFHPRDYAPFFRECGTKAVEKHIPVWMFDATPDLLQKLFDGLMDSDGHRQRGKIKTGYTYHTASEKLAQDVALLAIKLGLRASIQAVRPRSGKFESGPSWFVYIASTSPLMGTVYRSVKEVHYTGKVWCPEVADNGNLLVERNGKFAFCGNTTYIDKDEIVNNATLVKKTDVPKWMDIIMYETDAVVKTQIDTVDGQERFRLYVISSKIGRFKTGQVLDVTGARTLADAVPVGEVPTEMQVDVQKAMKRKKERQRIDKCPKCSGETTTEMGILHCTKCDWVHEDEGD